jgi:predicted dehydrogenase
MFKRTHDITSLLRDHKMSEFEIPKFETPIRWGIIGCGDVTEIKSGPAYQKTKDFELVAVMRRNLSLAKNYAQRHNVKYYYDNADELINNPDIDAIYIATPPDSHKFYGLKVAQAGKPCCIEKPLSPSYQDSIEIVNAFNKANQPLFVAYYRRSLPRFNKIKSLIEAGDIGQVRHISWHLNKPASKTDLSGQYNWRTDNAIAMGGYFDDVASHGLDLFSYLLGDFKEVRGLGINQQNLYSSFDAITACWLHDNGVTGCGSWNFGGNTRQDQVTIYGSKGEISFGIFEEKPITVQQNNRADENSSTHVNNAQSNQYQIMIEHPENIQLHHVGNIKDQLLYNKLHPSTGQTALHTSWVMEKICKG